MMYQCKQWIQISSISYYKGYYIQKFSYANFPGGEYASWPQPTRAALNPNRQLPWCFLIFLGETLEERHNLQKLHVKWSNF